MPLPTPNKNESRSDFITRCLADEVVKNDFTSQDQRLAVCYKQWTHDKSPTLGKVQYCVRAQTVEQDGKKYALVEVIDESLSNPVEQPSGVRVRINPAGKARALASLLENPLLGPPELGHDATQVVGRPANFMSNHVTQVLYEIQDPDAWDHINSGDWGPVSPQLGPISSHYEGDELVLDEWTWDNVAFVPKGAYPNAGVKSTWVGEPQLRGFYGAVAAAAADSSKSRLKAQRPRTETDVGAYSPPRGKAGKGPEEKPVGPPGGVTMEKDKNDKEVIAELTDAKTQLEVELADAKTKHEAEVKELTQAKAKVDAELKDVKAKQDKTKAAAPPDEAVVTLQAEMKAVKAENETLKAWKLAQEDIDHMHRVQDVVDLQASLLDTKKVQAAVESLKKLPNEALDAMKAQLEGVKGKFDSLPSGPKARLIPGVAAAGFDPMQPTIGDRVGKKPGEQ